MAADRSTKDGGGTEPQFSPKLSSKGQADAAARQGRLADQLRSNLLRRKAQQRGRRDDVKPIDAKEE